MRIGTAKSKRTLARRSYVAGLLDLEERLVKLSLLGDPLEGLKALIDWEAFRPQIDAARRKQRKSAAGAKPFDAILMFRLLILQQLHKLSDERLKYQIRDRLSFLRFLGLNFKDRVPDAKTVWLFLETLKAGDVGKKLFACFEAQLAAHGLKAQGGQMIDATFVEVPKQRNSREQNATIKAGGIPDAWQRDDPATVNPRRQKNTDARWAKKGDETQYGYKNHINADAKHKLIRAFEVTGAQVHDSKVFDPQIDHTLDEHVTKRAVTADSAYRSVEREAAVKQAKFESRICEKGAGNAPVTEAQKASNHEKSIVRCRVEHIFGAQAQMGVLSCARLAWPAPPSRLR